MKNIVNVLILVGLFLCSFVFFLFMTFPYEVLKESIAAEMSQSTGYTIRIGTMSANFPLGITCENVRIEAPNSPAALNLSSISADVSILSLLLARVNADVEVEAKGGYVDVGVGIGVFDLIGGQVVPRRFTFEAKNFPLDELTAFGLGLVANGPGANPMLAPILSAIGVSGLLNGNMDFKIDPSNLPASTGSADISLARAVLILSHPSLGLTDQELAKASIKAKVEGGAIVLDKNSGLASEELELLTDGKMTLKKDIFTTFLDLKVIFRLNKGLKEKFGFLIDAMTGSATNEGQLTMQVRGPLDQPAVTTL